MKKKKLIWLCFILLALLSGWGIGRIEPKHTQTYVEKNETQLQLEKIKKSLQEEQQFHQKKEEELKIINQNPLLAFLPINTFASQSSPAADSFVVAKTLKDHIDFVVWKRLDDINANDMPAQLKSLLAQDDKLVKDWSKLLGYVILLDKYAPTTLSMHMDEHEPNDSQDVMFQEIILYLPPGSTIPDLYLRIGNDFLNDRFQGSPFQHYIVNSDVMSHMKHPVNYNSTNWIIKTLAYGKDRF